VERFFIEQKNNQWVKVGGVRLLSEFSPEQIIVKVRAGSVSVSGAGLKIATFNENEIEITGKISNVETMGGGGGAAK
jgi:sporulation protein YqfC